MSKFSIFILLFILVGTVYFREVFNWIWLGLGILFVIFLIVFHILDGKGKYSTPYKKDKDS